MLEVIQKVDLVVLSQWIKEALVAFVRGNVDGGIVGYLFGGHFENIGCFGTSDSVLKISSPHVERIKLVRFATGSCQDALSNGLDNTSRGALDFVNISNGSDC